MVRMIFGSTCWDYISACLTHVTNCRRSNLPMRKLCSKCFNCFSRLNADRCAFNRSETGLLKRIDSDVFSALYNFSVVGEYVQHPAPSSSSFRLGDEFCPMFDSRLRCKQLPKPLTNARQPAPDASWWRKAYCALKYRVFRGIASFDRPNASARVAPSNKLRPSHDPNQPTGRARLLTIPKRQPGRRPILNRSSSTRPHLTTP